MRTVIIGLTLAVIVILVALVALLVILRAGIRRQKGAACLICHPPGLTAAIARRVLNMHFRAPEQAHEHRHTCRAPSVPDGQPCLSAKKGSAS
jgi:hypothetical protein